jgi:hypothetical protein
MAMHCLKPMLSLCSVLTAVAILAPAHRHAETGPGGPFVGLSGQWSATLLEFRSHYTSDKAL